MSRSRHHGCGCSLCRTPWLVDRKLARAPNHVATPQRPADQLDPEDALWLELEVAFTDPEEAYGIGVMQRAHDAMGSDPEGFLRVVDDLLEARDRWEQFKLEQLARQMIGDALDEMTAIVSGVARVSQG